MWVVKAVLHLSCGKQPLFQQQTQDGSVQAEDLYMITIVFESIVKSTMEN